MTFDHRKLTPLQAALDPRTPEDWLLHCHPVRVGFEDDVAWYRAVASRDPLGESLQRPLHNLAVLWPGPDDCHEQVLAAAIALPRRRTEADLVDLAGVLRWGAQGRPGCRGRHRPPPLQRARALQSAQAGDNGPAARAAAAGGSFVPYARWLARTGRRGTPSTLNAVVARHATLATRIAASYPDPGTRRVDAQASMTWTGSTTALRAAVTAATT